MHPARLLLLRSLSAAPFSAGHCGRAARAGAAQRARSSWAAPRPPQPQQRRAMASAGEGAAAASARKPCRIGVGQMTSVGDQLANFETCKRLAEEAVSKGCRVLFLPECFSFIGTSQPESLSKAEPLEGPAMGRFRQLARDTGLWLSLGGFQEKGPDPQHLYNCHVVLDSTGATAATYRKIHLFDVDVPNGPVLMESRTTAPGNKLVVCDSPAGVLGLTVCYDLRFPDMYQRLTWGMGAQVLLVPSAFTKVTGAAHWEILLRARAIECQAFVVAAAQAGRHNEKRESYGDSLVINPWGEIIARFEDKDATGLITADIDLDDLERVREKMPIQAHRARGRAQYLGPASDGAA
ncbi:nitrilase [Raphidocelis subcapitata]|uniref:Nitrilase n=1 Tax=Raphidocelis subcapitata TaxID=307507 RepID=A0A2V0P3M6_9CHLO|nr:nitrilase [Raphidocelis subcapitata]|eukprot:GBF91685.1 nitrilase [Raphidocelis subcapitata]